VFPGKTGQQVAERWDKVLNPSLTKGSWTREEDQIIIDFVRENGSKRWQKVSTLLPGRIGKQCRERWRNHLDPAVDHSPWTVDEDNRLRALHQEFGNQWVKIAALMSRSDNAVKNRWNAALRKDAGVGEIKKVWASLKVDQADAQSPPILHLPVRFIAPVWAGARIAAGARACKNLEENRRELLRLMGE
jgi:hypothetical protein